MKYKIIRMFLSDDHPSKVIKTNLTLAEAQAHCANPETSSKTCVGSEGLARTILYGPWFDGYDEM